MADRTGPSPSSALHGLKVVEVAQVIAGPFAGTLLADLGADVVHIEDPERGDPQRTTGIADENGVYLWWKVSGRNKRSVTINLRTSEGQELARELIAWADVFITNFRVPTLESWGLDWESVRKVNEKLVMLQISGFGTNTSRRGDPGFGKVGEAMSGVVTITGEEDGRPIHTGFSHADSVTGLMGAFAIQSALYRRDHDSDFRGEHIDLALFEPLYRLIEWQVIVHDQTGMIPKRAGNQLPVSPAAVINSYLTSDEVWITVTSGTPKSVRNVVALLGLPAEEYHSVEQQNHARLFLDAKLGEWVRERTASEALEAMARAEVVASRIFDISDILKDKTYQEREAIITVDDPELGPVKMQSVIPKLTQHSGAVWRSGPALGQDNDYVYKGYLNKSEEELSALKEQGII